VAAVLSGLISKAAVFGFIRICFGKFPEPFDDWRTVFLALAVVGLVYGSLLAFRAPDIRGVIAYSSLAQMGLITIGVFAENPAGLSGAVLQAVNHGLISATLFLLAGAIERRTSTGDFDRLGGMARGRPALATALMVTGVIALAVPGSSAFAGEFLILAGVFSSGWGWAVAGAAGIVLAAMYMLRLISAVLHRDPGPAVSDSALDLRPAELGIVVPLVACLLALSAWPAAISGNTLERSSSTPALGELVPPSRSLAEVRAELDEQLEAQLRNVGAPANLPRANTSWVIGESPNTPAFAPSSLQADASQVVIIVGSDRRAEP
jgi:NADH-quinone oxidoreductase subunit M